MIKQAYEKYMATVNKTWGHDRSKTIGASEIGQCSRRMQYVKQQHPVDKNFKDTWGARYRGDIIEAHMWVPAMQHTYGKDFIMGGADQKTLIDEPLSATPDGLLINQPKTALKHLGIPDIKSKSIVMECKSIDPRVNLEEEKHVHFMQTQVQIGLIRKLTPHKPVFAVVSYTDASWLDTVTEFPIEFSQKVFDQAYVRARSILSGEKQKRDGWIMGGWECKHCPYLSACDLERRDLPFPDKDIDPQFKAEIIDTCAEINAIRSRLDVDEVQLRTKQEELKERLREKGVREIKGVLRWQSVKGRSSYDYDAMRKAKIKLEKFEVKGPSTDRLTITKTLPTTIDSEH